MDKGHDRHFLKNVINDQGVYEKIPYYRGNVIQDYHIASHAFRVTVNTQKNEREVLERVQSTGAIAHYRWELD